MRTRNKLWTILAVFILLLVLAGFGAYGRLEPYTPPVDENADCGNETVATRTGIIGTRDLAGRKLGGVVGRMPESSAKIFFEGMTGCKLASYETYASPEACITALRSGWIDAFWVTDLTGFYLCKQNPGLIMTADGYMAEQAKHKYERFQYGMAVRNDKAGQDLRDSLNQALDELEAAGDLADLVSRYIYDPINKGSEEYKEARVDAMTLNSAQYKKAYKGKKAIKVGVTGAVPPVELLDEYGEPYGFCVALMDSIGLNLQLPVEFEVLNNETAFSSLMSGRVDLVFSYGAGNITTEGSKNWLMTRGYVAVNGYSFITE